MGKKLGGETIRGAGRTLSDKNATELVSVVKILTQLLDEAGINVDEYDSEEGARSRYVAMDDSSILHLGASNKTEITITARSVNIGQIVIASHSNKHPFSGVLFDVDKASEAIPAKGPDLPLFIPATVALKAAAEISCLPIDAHDSLSQHADNEIVGTIESACVSNGQFIVHGYLWPFNQQKKVASILASQKTLGMSMNARAEGYPVNKNGSDYFEVTNLKILGANILHAHSATYQKTSIVASSKDHDLMDEELKKTLLQIQSGIESFNTELISVKSDLTTLMGEREAEIAAATKEESDRQRNEEVQHLTDKISSSVIQQLAASGIIKGRGRVSTPLTQQGIQAGSEQVSNGLSPLQTEAVELACQLKQVRATPVMTSLASRLQLTERLNQLKQELLNQGEGIPESIVVALSGGGVAND